MAKAKKLKSGNWQIQPMQNGQRVSFTAPTKAEVEAKASLWKLNQKNISMNRITLLDAARSYIDDNEGSLSPSTIRGYNYAYKRLIDHDIAYIRIDSITTSDVQRLINKLSNKYAPKTVKNTYGLISATLRYMDISSVSRINLPKEPEKAYLLPNLEEMKQILEIVAGTEMEIPILLAAFGGMRRSEIAALTKKDIKDHSVFVHSAIVEGSDMSWHQKGTKTKSSTRIVSLPDFVIDKLKNAEQICTLNPDAITNRWIRIRDQIGIKTRFHDLRHYSASLMHAEGIPDQYIMSKHGWKTDYALKKIYRNELDEYTDMMNSKFNDILSEKFSNANSNAKI